MNRQTHIIIFAKAPLAGFAKTRLIPALGEKGAAQLAKRLFDHALAEALSADIGSVELCVTPGLENHCWKNFQFPENLTLTEQGEGDLGERMARASKRSLGYHESVLLIGTDCPELNRSYLQEAADELSCHDACLTPVSDGGYALMGLKAFHSSLFEDMPWSTDKVSALTLERFRKLDWQVAHLKPLHDIDEADDLKYLPEKFSSGLSF
jgi:rSAM/selenodomain-associated transferase 1